MEPRRSYLDHNATAPVRPEAAEAVARALAIPGNPSSIHADGRAARAVVEQAREEVAALAGVAPRQVVFTSGGTEGAAILLRPGLRRHKGDAPAGLLLVSATEHPCVRDGHGFPADAVETIPVDGEGLVDLVWLEARLARHVAAGGSHAVVSVHLANNETGVIQPLAEIAGVTHRYGAILHSDMVQAFGRIPVDLPSLGVDVATVSAHKLGGPKGVGAILMARPDGIVFESLTRGGGQERGIRPGTENVSGIAGFGAAAAVAASDLAAESIRLAGLRDGLEARLAALSPETVVFGRKAPRLPNTTALATPGQNAGQALIFLDLAHISVSSGAACSSGKLRRSHVLDAMGVPGDLADAALRISLGWSSTREDIESFVDAYGRLLTRGTKQRAA